VYLQVWRPVDSHPARSRGVRISSSILKPSSSVDVVYALVGQTLFAPQELRFHEIPLSVGEFIRVRRGDVLGLYYFRHNPLPWSAIPCSADSHQYLYTKGRGTSGLEHSVVWEAGGRIKTGTNLTFTRASHEEPHPCRQYSFLAVFGKKLLFIFKFNSKSQVTGYSKPKSEYTTK